MCSKRIYIIITPVFHECGVMHGGFLALPFAILYIYVRTLHTDICARCTYIL